MKRSAAWSPVTFARLPLVSVRRAGPIAWLECGGCRRSSDVVRDAEGNSVELSVASIRHGDNGGSRSGKGCPVAGTLWRSLMATALDDNGRDWNDRPWRREPAA